jgi:hypothetical protein
LNGFGAPVYKKLNLRLDFARDYVDLSQRDFPAGGHHQTADTPTRGHWAALVLFFDRSHLEDGQFNVDRKLALLETS